MGALVPESICCQLVARLDQREKSLCSRQNLFDNLKLAHFTISFSQRCNRSNSLTQFGVTTSAAIRPTFNMPSTENSSKWAKMGRGKSILKSDEPTVTEQPTPQSPTPEPDVYGPTGLKLGAITLGLCLTLFLVGLVRFIHQRQDLQARAYTIFDRTTLSYRQPSRV